MQTAYGHLGYCTNIHPCSTWEEHFSILKKNIPLIRESISPGRQFGLGLRLSAVAAEELAKNDELKKFKSWLKANQVYVFTMNGFPYGDFNRQVVKQAVHEPDWKYPERVKYTVQLFDILEQLLPPSLEGSISTSPLSYRHWYKTNEDHGKAMEQCTLNILEVVFHLVGIYLRTGKVLHLDPEPEPDGLFENTEEFIHWYNHYYLPMGVEFLAARGMQHEPEEQLRKHLRLCYDVCHSALEYESPGKVAALLAEHNIAVGKVQLSSALHIDLRSQRDEKIRELTMFNEPMYLHQVVAKDNYNELHKFPDLQEALPHLYHESIRECRVHFHVPVFLQSYGLLSSTQEALMQVLSETGFSSHWEVETYTWHVLPRELQLPAVESICRELVWVENKMKNACIEQLSST